MTKMLTSQNSKYNKYLVTYVCGGLGEKSELSVVLNVGSQLPDLNI